MPPKAAVTKKEFMAKFLSQMNEGFDRMTQQFQDLKTQIKQQSQDLKTQLYQQSLDLKTQLSSRINLKRIG